MDRLERLVRFVLRRHEEVFSAAVLARLRPETIANLDGLLHPPARGGAEEGGEDGRDPSLLIALRAGTGQASLKSVDDEAATLPLSIPGAWAGTGSR